MGWLIPRDELTAEQIRAIELDPSEHRVILGAPGSGKTQILLHRARFLCDEYGVAPDRFHVFVFTNVLKDYIRTALSELDLPDEAVTTLDDWCVQTYRRLIGANLPWDHAKKTPDYAAIRSAVRNRVKGRRLFDFALVDEGQDLDHSALGLIRDLARHVTVALDHKQQIYPEGSGEAEILRTLGLRRTSLVLLEAFRCSPYIVRVASEFIEDAAEREAFRRQSRTAQTDIQTPFLYEADDFEDESQRLVEVLRERQLVDRSIAVLFAKNRQAIAFARDCRRQGIPIETRQDGLDFTNDTPKALTYHSAKGLTFDSVLLPRLVHSSFPAPFAGRTLRLLYVGITRATRWVYFSGVRNNTIEALERIRALSRLQPPVVTVGIPHRPARSTDSASGPDDVLDIL